MPADDFRSELHSALISYYDCILKIAGVIGSPEPKPELIMRSFNARRVDPPAAAAPPPADPAPPPAAVKGEDPERTPPRVHRQSPAAASPAVDATAAGGQGKGGAGGRGGAGKSTKG